MGSVKNILVVDDLPDNREQLSQILDSEYRVTLAPGAREAIASIADHRPDLVVLDLAMPDVDGFAVLQFLSEHPEPFLPVIVLSAVTERDARIRALRMGAHEFIARPFDIEEVTIRVRAMIALKQATDLAAQRSRDLEATVAERTQELQQALESLRNAERYKGEILSVISHELRTPLNFISGFASILEDELSGALNPTQRDHLARIMEGTERMTELVSNLLDVSSLAAGRFHIDTREEPFEPLVERTLEAMRPMADQKGVAVESDVCVRKDVVLDPERTVQVLTNLVQNAIKFTPRGGRIVVKAFLREGELVAEVSDDGIGIPPRDLPRLFQTFSQVDMSSTREVGGSGLGLRISKGIVEAHGGHIGVRSEPEQGSTFWFTLPAES